jgi:hypothetical protein
MTAVESPRRTSSAAREFGATPHSLPEADAERPMNF